MRLYQPSYNAGGKTKKVKKWWIQLDDHTGTPRHFAGFTTEFPWGEEQTRLLGAQIQRLVNYRAAGEMPDAQLSKWLEDIPGKLQAKLVKFGILDRSRAAVSGSLAELIDKWREFLPVSIKQNANRVARIAGECEFNNWSDVNGPVIDNWIRRLDVEPQTRKHYVVAFRQFCKWLKRSRYISDAPQVASIRVPKKIERAFEIDEFSRLLEAAKSGPERYGLSGPTRYLVYRIAEETGLRVKELRSLTPASFDVRAQSLFVGGAYTKNSNHDEQRLSGETAALLQEYTQGKQLNDQLFKLPHATAVMIRKDCKAAGIEVVNNRGKIRFHSLRHTCGTFLAAAGVHPKTIQTIMRHGDINLTMSRYCHNLRGQVAAAIDALPSFAPRRQAKEA